MQTETEKPIDETKVGKNVVTISRRFDDGFYGGTVQRFEARINGKLFDSVVTGDIRETYLPKQALDIFKDAKIAARSC